MGSTITIEIIFANLIGAIFFRFIMLIHYLYHW